MTLPWDSLTADEQALFARMAEVYAGFLGHVDSEIGRLLGFLEEFGWRENTIVIVVSDNGASGEGGPNGSVNEMKFANGIPDTMEANLPLLDQLGSPTTYNHYPNGWAMAFNTPFKMWKRYEFNGGTSDPCIISWPAGTTARGEIREQYHHAIDLVPTILDVLGVEAPGDAQGPHPEPRSTASACATASTTRPRRRRGGPSSTRCSAHAGIWHDGWKAITTHPTLSGWSHFNDDEWELYHIDVDRSELHNLADEHPDKVRELVNLWYAEAGANGAFPLDDRSALEIMLTPRPVCRRPATGTSTSPTPPTCPSPRRSTSATAPTPSVPSSTSRRPAPRACCSPTARRSAATPSTSRTTGSTTSTTSSGMSEEKVVGTVDVPTGENLILSASFDKDGEDPPGVATGMLSLWHGDDQGRRGPHQDPARQVHDRRRGTVHRAATAAPGSPTDYPGELPWRFTGGTIRRVAVDVSGEPYVDLEREAAAMLMRE